MNRKGFTLFELLVTVSIIGILIAVIVVSFSSAQRKGRDARRVQDMDMIQKAAEQYYSQANYVYPSNTAPGSWGNIIAYFPVDPKGTGWTGYTYSRYAGQSTFCACAALESASTGNSNDPNCATPFVNGTGLYYCVKNQQ